MRLIDADSLIKICKEYLKELNPDRDGKEYAKVYWLINVLENTPTIDKLN